MKCIRVKKSSLDNFLVTTSAFFYMRRDFSLKDICQKIASGIGQKGFVLLQQNAQFMQLFPA